MFRKTTNTTRSKSGRHSRKPGRLCSCGGFTMMELIVIIIMVGILGAGLAVEAAITLVQWNVTHRIKPQSLPRMDFSTGIPSESRTLVVVPAMLA